MFKTQLLPKLLTALFVVSCGVSAQDEDLPLARGDGYVVDRSFFKLPAGRTIGSAPSIDISPAGDILWVVDRCGANDCVGSSLDPVLAFDLTGKLLRSFGSNLFVRPHGLHLDHDGNVWVTDGEGPNGIDPRRSGKGHQVFKFNATGELLMRLGVAGVAGDGPNEFNQPSDVVVAANGDIFIADGHGGESNARLVKYSSDGTFLKSWGGSGNGLGKFATPHTIAMDSLGRLFVGDRGNKLVQLFDQDGNFLEQWSGFGDPSGIHIDANDIIYVTDSTSRPGKNRGIRIASVADGKVINFIPDTDETASQEDVVADAAGNIYGSSTRSMSLQKYSPAR
ncbi:MAG: peptidyl-alpha-hydroxyglycine alpha-amidating lyase family protein [Pseudohongiellaceae bacterium]